MSKQREDPHVEPRNRTRTSPFTPHTAADVDEMLRSVGASSVDDLFDIPEQVAFDGEFDVDAKGERQVVDEVSDLLGRNETAVEFLGRGHASHYVPSVVDYLALRSEFLTSYTQYQPETSQGFLQALFEYQSILVELTGLGVANCSVYDAATALGEAATLATRVRDTDGDRVLVPDLLREGKRSVLESYADGADLSVETYPTRDGNAVPEDVAAVADDEVVLLYAESPTSVGTIEEHLGGLADLAEDHGAAFCLGTDPVALALLEEPAAVGADVVIGDASVLGLPTSFGMGLGLFVVREDYLRQVPGRLVGASEDADGRRAFTLTLQTREQHIRKERATSNICTNQAWVALRAAVHAASLGATGLAELAEDCVRYAAETAERLDEVDGVTAPAHDRYHFREFVVETDAPASEVREGLADRGYLVHAVGDHRLQVCVTETNRADVDGLVAAFEEVAA